MPHSQALLADGKCIVNIYVVRQSPRCPLGIFTFLQLFQSLYFLTCGKSLTDLSTNKVFFVFLPKHLHYLPFILSIILIVRSLIWHIRDTEDCASPAATCPHQHCSVWCPWSPPSTAVPLKKQLKMFYGYVNEETGGQKRVVTGYSPRKSQDDFLSLVQEIFIYTF